jgi:hypothetical protein
MTGDNSNKYENNSKDKLNKKKVAAKQPQRELFPLSTYILTLNLYLTRFFALFEIFLSKY